MPNAPVKCRAWVKARYEGKRFVEYSLELAMMFMSDTPVTGRKWVEFARVDDFRTGIKDPEKAKRFKRRVRELYNTTGKLPDMVKLAKAFA